jgi:site-specific recombinase XerD
MKGCRNLTDEEIVNVYNELSTPRDKNMFLVGVLTGLRISELLSLRVKDVYENGRMSEWITVARKNTKGKIESKTLPMVDEARNSLEKFISSMENPKPTDPLFKSTQGDKAISRVMAHKILKKAFTSLKMTGKLSTHSCRKSFAQRIHKELGNRIERTQVALCHKSLSSTVSYIQVDREEVENGIRNVGGFLAGKIVG